MTPRRRSGPTARSADKYALYQAAVQSPELDVHFMSRVYRKLRGQPARHLREDFSGTALLSSHWIRRGARYTAEAFDIDPEPLAWGREHNFEPLGRHASRVILHQNDVRAPSRRPPDLRCAHNFSYWIFKSRAEMLGYFRSAYDDLAEDGLFVLDAHGGSQSTAAGEHETPVDEGFVYVWDQRDFSPVTHEAQLYIHFRFGDGSQLRRAFSYRWRMWTLPEIRDLLLEAGFRRVDVYWEGTSEDGVSGNGVYRRTDKGSNDDTWVAYITAPK